MYVCMFICIQTYTQWNITTTTTKSPQSCPTLFYPMDCSPPGFSVHGILQARTLEWVAISFSNAWKWKVKVKSLSRVRLLETPWTAAYQAPPSMGFSRQEYWSGVPLPSPNGILLSQKKEWKLPLAATWLDLENVILSEVNQTENNKYYIITCGI